MRVEYRVEGLTGFQAAYRGHWTLFGDDTPVASGSTEWTEDIEAIPDMISDDVEMETTIEVSPLLMERLK